MKKFRKNEQGLFICEECGLLCKDKTVLSVHNIKIHKLSVKEYFDKWLKEEADGLCKICSKETGMGRAGEGYKSCCSKECSKIYTQQRTEEGSTQKYGVKNVYQSEEIKEKCKQTKFEKYGDEKYQNREQIEKTNIEKYGFKNPFQSEEIRDKCYQRNINNYGFKYSWQREDVKQKIKQTNLQKFGFEHASQNINVYNKGLKTRFLIHKYKDTDLTYQGSYELDFLETFINIFPDIKNGPSIKYIFDNKNKVYHPDFYIPSKNLIIEIKSSWTLKLDENIEEKKKATIANGFNYIMILDKNYSDIFYCILHEVDVILYN